MAKLTQQEIDELTRQFKKKTAELKDIYDKLAEAGEYRDKINQFIRLAFDDVQKTDQIIVFQRLDFFLFDTGQDNGIQRIVPDIAQLLCLFQRLMERTVDVFDRFRRQVLFIQQFIVKMLDHMRCQGRKLKAAKIWLQMNTDAALIATVGRRLEIRSVFFQPNIQPRFELHAAGLNIDTVIDFRLDLRQLLPDFFLRCAIDGFALLLSGFGIETNRVSAFPASIRSFADHASAAGISF